MSQEQNISNALYAGDPPANVWAGREERTRNVFRLSGTTATFCYSGAGN